MRGTLAARPTTALFIRPRIFFLGLFLCAIGSEQDAASSDPERGCNTAPRPTRTQGLGGATVGPIGRRCAVSKGQQTETGSIGELSGGSGDPIREQEAGSNPPAF